LEKKEAEPKPILAEVVELVRDLAAEGLHGARLGRDLGGRLLDATLGCGAADELRAEAAASLSDSAEALRRAVAANLALARSAVVVQGRALDWTAAMLEGWLASRQEAKGEGTPEKPRPRHDRDERRARLATLLRVISGFRGAKASAPVTPVTPRAADATLRLTRAGGTTTIHLLHPGPDEVRARFHVGPCTREDGGASFRVHVGLDPEELTLRPQVEEPVRVTMPWDPRFEVGGAYRLAIVVAGMGAQVVVRIIVADEEAS
jgi:hypothetical protein